MRVLKKNRFWIRFKQFKKTLFYTSCSVDIHTLIHRKKLFKIYFLDWYGEANIRIAWDADTVVGDTLIVVKGFLNLP